VFGKKQNKKKQNKKNKQTGPSSRIVLVELVKQTRQNVHLDTSKNAIKYIG
jgi:hypothetical protein